MCLCQSEVKKQLLQNNHLPAGFGEKSHVQYLRHSVKECTLIHKCIMKLGVPVGNYVGTPPPPNQ